MNTTVAVEWFKKGIASGAALLSGFITTALMSRGWDSVAAASVGSSVAIIGATVASKSIPYLIPTAAKVASQNQAPPPATLQLPGSNLRK